jgi:hypothetical protein
MREARAAAQRAFFQAALDRTQAPAPTAGRQDQAAQAATSRASATQPDTPPDRPLRPGSLVNILV